MRREKASLLIFLLAVIAGCAPQNSDILQSTHIYTEAEDGQITAIKATKSKSKRFDFEFQKEDADFDGSSTSFVPASINKLFTVSWALATLSPQYQYDMKVRFNRSIQHPEVIRELRIQGDGDPTVASSNWDMSEVVSPQSLVVELSRQGVKTIEGPLTLIEKDIRWRQLKYPTGFDRQDLPTCYGALGQSFNLDSNCASFVVKQGAGQWNSPNVVDPVATQIDNNLKNSIFFDVTMSDPPQLTMTTGSIKNAKARWFMLPVYHIQAWFKNALLNRGAKQGIVFSDATNPDDSVTPEEISFRSPSLDKIVKQIAKNSDNFAADTLFKTVSSQTTSENADLLSVSQRGIKDFLATKLEPLDLQEIKIVDGSGLSHENSVTPRAYFHFLKTMKSEPYWNVFLESLPIAGVDGTLKDRFRKCSCKGWVKAKTGTLEGYFQLAGYVAKLEKNGKQTSVKDWVPFVLLTHGTPNQKWAILKLHEQMVQQLFKELNP